jgi:hypothetical protein
MQGTNPSKTKTKNHRKTTKMKIKIIEKALATIEAELEKINGKARSQTKNPTIERKTKMKIETGYLTGNLPDGINAAEMETRLTEKLSAAFPDAEIVINSENAEGSLPWSCKTKIDGDTDHEDCSSVDDIFSDLVAEMCAE